MAEIKIYLGPQENKLLMTLEKDDKIVFTITDVKNILDSPGPSAKKVVYRLKKKNRIIEIERGKYLLSPAKSGIEGYWSEHTYKIIPALLKEYYISYWSALNYWEMSDQIPRITYVATPKIKKEIEIKGQLIKFITIDPKKFYGYGQRTMGNTKFNIASKEKTIIDCLDRLDYSGGIIEVAKGLWFARKRLDFNVLVDNAVKFPNKAVQRRLGFLLDSLGLGTKTDLKRLRKKFTGYRWLDHSAEKKNIEYDNTWGLMINIRYEDLTNWKD